MRYVYAVVRSRHPPPPARGVGVAHADVRLIRSGQLAAAVSDVATDQSMSDEDARAHLTVLTDLLRDGPVLPVQLGTAVQSDQDVRTQVIDADAPRLAAMLDELEDVVEVHVDADDDEGRALAEVAAMPGLRDREAVGLPAALEQGRRVGAALMARREQLADAVLTRLRPLCADDAPRATIGGPEGPVLRWAFLVRRDQLTELDDEMTAVRGEFPALTFRYVGPLPPVHFLARVTAGPPAADAFDSNGTWGW